MLRLLLAIAVLATAPPAAAAAPPHHHHHRYHSKREGQLALAGVWAQHRAPGATKHGYHSRSPLAHWGIDGGGPAWARAADGTITYAWVTVWVRPGDDADSGQSGVVKA